MKEVLKKAQELAEAILESDIYQRMHLLEREMAKNLGVQQAMTEVSQARRNVENILSRNDLDQHALQQASDALHQAEEKLGAISLIQEVSDASSDFSDMMENVNQILRLVLTGVSEGDQATPKRQCGGGCGGCIGCHHG